MDDTVMVSTDSTVDLIHPAVRKGGPRSGAKRFVKTREASTRDNRLRRSPPQNPVFRETGDAKNQRVLM